MAAAVIGGLVGGVAEVAKVKAKVNTGLYDLRSVVMHHGRGLDTGHYTASCLDTDRGEGQGRDRALNDTDVCACCCVRWLQFMRPLPLSSLYLTEAPLRLSLPRCRSLPHLSHALSHL